MQAQDLLKVPGDVLTCEHVAAVLGACPQTIRTQARKDPAALGFPVVVAGNRVKIPKVPFLRFMGVIE